MVYGLDKMVYGLPWLDKTAMKWSTGDKMVYGLPSFDKTAMGLEKRPSGVIKWSTGDKIVYGLPWLDKTAIKWSTGDKMVYGLLRSIGLDKTAIGAIKWSTGDKMVYVDKTASGGNRMVYGRYNGLRAALA